jgi:hypothetical protein
LWKVQTLEAGAGSQTPAVVNHRQPPAQLATGNRQPLLLFIIHHSTFIIPSTAFFNLLHSQRVYPRIKQWFVSKVRFVGT